MKFVGKYGIKFLDDRLCGIFNTELVVIGANSGCGKSSLANMIALNFVKQGIKPALLSLENFKGDSILKQTFIQWKKDNAPQNKALWGTSFRQWLVWYCEKIEAAGESYKTALNSFSGMCLLERPKGAFTIETLELYFKKSAEAGCKVIILDHLDYLDYLENTENDITHVRAIMNKIRKLQDEYEIPVIAFSQFRKNIAKDVIVPNFDELYGSGDKAKQSVVVIVLARDYENQMVSDDMAPTFMAIRKDRYGNQYSARVFFDLKMQEYTENYQEVKINFWGTEVKDV
jgi:replicative DNA helicase